MSGNVNLSVVIPNHNYGKWLGEAVISVATDPYPAKQIVIVNDGSTDNSWLVIRNLLGIKDEQPTEQRLYMDKAGGPSKARNIGISIGFERINLYGFLDADDIYLPGKISKSIERFLQDPGRIGAIYTDYDTIDVNTDRRVRVYKEPYDYNRLMQECIVHSACMVNKIALEQCGLYDEGMRCCEDWDMWLRIAEKFVLVHIPEPLMLVRVGAHNSSNTVSKAIWQQNWQRIRDKVQQRHSQHEQ
jgi:glycosyltransferase involved in cell wall biosynthesis